MMKLMKSASVLYMLTLLSGIASCLSAYGQDKVTDLRTEYLNNPIGIDTKTPRFAWKLNSARLGARQSAYRLLIDPDSLKILKGEGETWAYSTTDNCNHTVYAGSKLQPYTKYFWSVQVDNEQKQSITSGVASFETGKMAQNAWTGDWISDGNNDHFKPAPYFRKKFTVHNKISSARIYIAAAGLYELFINGLAVGNQRLNPMYTRFDRRNLYVTHDVTRQLQAGANAIGVILGNGWYNHQSTAVWHFDQAPWRARPLFCLDLRICYTDGTTETIATGKDWKTSTGPIEFNSIYTGEHYNALAEKRGWNTNTYNDEAWPQSEIKAAPSQNIVAQTLQPIRDVEILKPVTFKAFNNTSYLYSLEKNIAGNSEITVQGTPGTVLRIIHAELLGKNGQVDLSNIDYHYRPSDDKDPFQTDVFTLSGNGMETFRPRFNYKGFQFIQVESSKPVKLLPNSIKAYVMHSDVPPVGKIASSNPTLNSIWQAANNSYLSNLFGYPTDCPQREKNGWTGDAHIAIETALYNFDGITIYEKWLADHRDEQQPNGTLPAIIPTGGWGYSWANGPDWTSSIAIIPWQVYLFYGDSKILSDNYENIKRYAERIKLTSHNNLTDWGLGDWIPIKSSSSVELTSSIYYHTVVDIVANSAKLLGNQSDAAKYQQLAADIKNAINTKYFNDKTGSYASGTQTELSAPLFWKIVPEDQIKRVAANLAKRVKKDGNQLDVGLLGSKTILNALSENGYAELAYQLASKETYPSWGWWMKNGATTLMENWNVAAVKDNSKNHIMFGEISAWYYKALGGINPDANQPGFKNVILNPNFVNGLNDFEATFNGQYGKIISSWTRKGKRISYTITIPANSTATLHLPEDCLISFKQPVNTIANPSGKKTYALASGTYQCIIQTR